MITIIAKNSSLVILYHICQIKCDDDFSVLVFCGIMFVSIIICFISSLIKNIFKKSKCSIFEDIYSPCRFFSSYFQNFLEFHSRWYFTNFSQDIHSLLFEFYRYSFEFTITILIFRFLTSNFHHFFYFLYYFHLS